MSGIEDAWLMQRSSRRRWLRFAALHTLAEQVLRTKTACEEAAACVIDEVFADASPLSPAKVAGYVRDDVRQFETWLRSGVTKGLRAVKDLKALAVIVPDGAPYELQLALVSAPPSESDWPEAIRWRSSERVVPGLLGQLASSSDALSVETRRDSDYILPLAYSAFLLRDALRSANVSKPRTLQGALVSYSGGDNLIVPLP